MNHLFNLFVLITIAITFSCNRKRTIELGYNPNKISPVVEPIVDSVTSYKELPPPICTILPDKKDTANLEADQNPVELLEIQIIENFNEKQITLLKAESLQYAEQVLLDQYNADHFPENEDQGFMDDVRAEYSQEITELAAKTLQIYLTTKIMKILENADCKKCLIESIELELDQDDKVIINFLKLKNQTPTEDLTDSNLNAEKITNSDKAYIIAQIHFGLLKYPREVIVAPESIDSGFNLQLKSQIEMENNSPTIEIKTEKIENRNDESPLTKTVFPHTNAQSIELEGTGINYEWDFHEPDITHPSY